MYDVAKWIVVQFVNVNLLRVIVALLFAAEKWSGHGRTGGVTPYGTVLYRYGTVRQQGT